jgi:hypothetical protein
MAVIPSDKSAIMTRKRRDIRVARYTSRNSYNLTFMVDGISVEQSIIFAAKTSRTWNSESGGGGGDHNQNLTTADKPDAFGGG